MTPANLPATASTGCNAYGEVDHPPLLGMESGRRVRKSGVPITLLLLAFVVLTAGGGIAAYVWKSRSAPTGSSTESAVAVSQAGESASTPDDSPPVTEQRIPETAAVAPATADSLNVVEAKATDTAGDASDKDSAVVQPDAAADSVSSATPGDQREPDSNRDESADRHIGGRGSCGRCRADTPICSARRP